MGRAIVRDPQVFLFDEPLSNLDAKLRVQMRTEIKELHQRLKTTAIYVTHDQIEAMTMADRIVVMQHGAGGADRRTAGALRPPGQPVRRRLHRLAGHELHRGQGRQQQRSAGRGGADGTALPLPAGAPLRNDADIVYGIRPEHLHLREAGAGLEAEVVVVEPTGAETLLVTRIAGIECKAVFRERHQLEPGAQIGLEPQLDQVHLFDRSSGRRLVN